MTRRTIILHGQVYCRLLFEIRWKEKVLFREEKKKSVKTSSVFRFVVIRFLRTSASFIIKYKL